MSLDKEVYKLCNVIKKNKFSKLLKETLLEIKHLELSDYCKNKGLQIYGYLFLYNKREDISLSISELPLATLKTLETFQVTIEELNKKIIEKIIRKHQNLRDVFNPYLGYDYKFENTYNIKPFLEYEDYSELLIKIEETPIFKFIMNNSYEGQYMEKLNDKILGIENMIVNNKDNSFFDEIYNESSLKSEGEKRIISSILALVIFRDMIKNINQLIFQEIKDGKFKKIDENNLINYTYSSNAINTHYEALISPQSEEIFIEKYDILLLEIPQKDGSKDEKKICSIRGYNMSYNKDEGTLIRLILKSIDKNLIAFNSSYVDEILK
ncbi:MAG: hypothetical protein ACRCXY_10940 [Fusobacteriaceae bacterium]